MHLQKKKSLIVISLAIIAFLVLLNPLIASLKVLLMLSQEFPQIPIKPLHSLTVKPAHHQINLGREQQIKADLFLPNKPKNNPAIILAMGVRTADNDKPIMLGFSDTLARLGYVVLWPRLDDLEKEVAKLEKPQTFVESFMYLEKRLEVDSQRISVVGFSIGSSIALIAAQDENISKKLRSFIFFGGYYNLLDYLQSLSTKSYYVNNNKIPWEANSGAIDHARNILETEGLMLEDFSDLKLEKSTKETLLRFSPDQNIDNFKARIFILHDKSDTSVPYVESLKLKQSLERKVSTTFHLANLFEHIKPKKEVSVNLIKEFLGFFVFLYQVFLYL